MSVRRLLACFAGIGIAATVFAAALSLLATTPATAFRLWLAGGAVFSIAAGLALATTTGGRR